MSLSEADVSFMPSQYRKIPVCAMFEFRELSARNSLNLCIPQHEQTTDKLQRAAQECKRPDYHFRNVSPEPSGSVGREVNLPLGKAKGKIVLWA